MARQVRENDITGILKEIEEENAVKPYAVLEFINTTPLWPGGPLGAKTFKCMNSDTNNCIGPFLPGTQQVIGRLRWLTRTIEASIKNRCLSNKEVEELASKLFGNQEKVGKVIVRMDYLSRGKAYIDQRVWDNISILGHIVKNLGGAITDLFAILEAEGYSRLRKNAPELARRRYYHKPLLGKKLNTLYLKIKRNARNLLDSIPVEVYKLITIPRLRLAVQDIKSINEIIKLYEIQPLRENSVVISVKLYKRTGDKLSPTEKIFTVLLVVYLFTFIGLGKATSRGFGKFNLRSIKLDKELKEHIIKDDESLEQYLLKYRRFSNGEELLEKFKDLGVMLLRLGASLINGDVETDTLVSSIINEAKPCRIPRLSIAVKEARVITPLKHPCVYASVELTNIDNRTPGCINNKVEVRDVLEALSAIGKATIKSTWKIVHGRVRDPGVAYHTWPLGLPRGAKSFRVKTGYYKYTENTKLRRGRGDYIARFINYGRDYVDLRRSSPIIFTPYCINNQCSVLAVPFITIDDFTEILNDMIHIGVHRGRQRKTIIHVTEIRSSMINSETGCLRDPAGIATYDRGSGNPCPSEDIEYCADYALNTAFDWITRLLSG